MLVIVKCLAVFSVFDISFGSSPQLKAFCDPPDFGDPNMRFDSQCDDSFMEGKRCEVKCHLAIQLIGSDHITCRKIPGSDNRGYWDYGQGTNSSAVKPECPVHNCPVLRPPNFGYMTCDKWTQGTQCLIGCRKGYHFPKSAELNSPIYLCKQATGIWNNERVPDCEWQSKAERDLSSSYHLEGSCAMFKNQIKATYIREMMRIGACPAPFCKVENLDVRCG